MDRTELGHGIKMRPGMKCLLDLLRGRYVDLTYDQQDWDHALALAEEENILPWVAHLCGQHASTPPNLSDRLKKITRDAAVTTFYWTSELKGILRAFEERKIVVVPLKGPFLAERLFGDAALRVSYDLDLLVPKEALPQANTLLSALGFTADTPDDYHRLWRRGGTTVELHHDVENPLAFDFHISQVLGRARPAVFQGVPCWLLDPRDELLFLCLHGVRHTFARLSLVVDLCLAFEKLTTSDMKCLRPEMAERSSLLILGLAMAQRLQPTLGATMSPDAPLAQRRHLESLADRLWDRLLAQPSQPLDWRALHSFYLQIELPNRRLGRRLRHYRILLERIIKPDYEFAAKFGCRRAWQVRLLRPLRLVRDAVRHPGSLRSDSLGQ